MKRFVTALATAVFITALCYVLWGFYFEEYEPTLAALFYGIPCYPMLHEWITGGHFLLTPFISRASQILPGLPVYGIWICFLNFLWLTGLAWLSAKVLSREERLSTLKILLSGLIVFLLSADSLVHFSFTRAGILMVGVALLPLEVEGRASFFRSAFFMLVFILGLLTRMSAAVIVFALVAAYSFSRTWSVKAVFQKYKYQALCILLCLIVFNIGSYTNDNFGLALESKYEYAISDNQMVPLSEMKTGLDSIKYMAVGQYLVTDSANINEAFVSKVVRLENHWKFLLIPGKWLEALSLCGQFAKQFYQLLLLQLFIFLAALYITDRRPALFSKVALLHVVFWLIILVLAISVDMFDRFFSPLLSVLALITLFTCLGEFEKLNNTVLKSAVLLSIGLAIALYCPLKDYAVQGEAQFQSHEQVLNNLHQYSSENTVVLLGIQRNLFSNKPFVRDHEVLYKNVMFADLANFCYFDFGKKKVIDRYGFSPLNYPAFCAYLNKGQQHIVILASERRMKTWTEYMHLLYHIDIQNAVLKREPLINDWTYYRIKL